MNPRLRIGLKASLSWIPPRWLSAPHRRKVRKLEREHLEEFRRFYADLPDKEGIFFVFFSSGLVQWLYRTVSFVPEDVNLVLIGSDLDPEEEAWVRETVRRPLHHVRMRTDDKTIWEFLFKTCEHNFGWLDIDCFVLEPDLFRQMREVEPDVVANCTWSFQAPGDRSLLCTFFLFMNVHALGAIRRIAQVSPTTYSHELLWRPGAPRPYALCEIPGRRQLRLLRQTLPCVGKLPVYTLPGGARFYDTLHVYQLVANALGYRLNKVRDLAAVDQHSSPELVHVGRVSYYRRWKERLDPGQQRVYRLLLQLDYVVLVEMGPRVPELYRRKRLEVESELERLNVNRDIDAIKEMVRGMMTEAGADHWAVSAIVGLEPTKKLGGGRA